MQKEISCVYNVLGIFFIVHPDVTDLLVPHPQNEKHKFFNDIVIKCAPLRGLFCGKAFRVHVKSECVSQWELETNVRGLENLLNLLSQSEDGHWLNVRKYSEDKAVLPSELNRLDNTISFIKSHINDVEDTIRKISGKRNSCYKADHSIIPQRSLEVSMCDTLLTRAKKVNAVLCSTLKALNSNKPVNSSVFNSSKQRHENTRKNARRKENDKKALREKHERVIASAVEVASPILPRGFATRIQNGDFSMRVDQSLLNKVALDELKPRFHLRGLEFLLSKELFVDTALDTIKGSVDSLKFHAQNTADANSNSKRKRMEKKESASKQPNLKSFFK